MPGDDLSIVSSAPLPDLSVKSSAPLPTQPQMGSNAPTGVRDSVAKWSQNVMDDIRNGTDITGVGTVLKKLGAHGTNYGTPEAVGDYMASLPLGVLRATKGAAEVSQGEFKQGAKDIGGGALQVGSGQVGGLVGAGPSEIGATTAEAGTNAVAGLVSKIKNFLSPTETAVDEWRKINSSIGATGKAVRVGRMAADLEGATTMPGRALSTVGLDSASLAKMTPPQQMAAIAPHWKEAGAAVDAAVNQATKAGKTLDVGDSAFSTLKKIANPELQEKAIDAFNSLAREIGIADHRATTPAEALQLRRALASGARFGLTGDLSSLGGVRAQLYRNVSGDLQKTVDGLKELDQHYSDLESGMATVQNKVSKFAVSEPKPTPIQQVGKVLTEKVLPKAIEGGAFGLGGSAVYRGIRALIGDSKESRP